MTKWENRWLWDKTLKHCGHRLGIVKYGDDDPAEICIKCEDCNCVILSLSNFKEE